MSIKLPEIIAVVGPNASGKSSLAVKLAKKFNGEIISADSRQVYKGFDLGSGKITKKEMQGVHHYLLDVISPKKTFTVAQYQKLARKAVTRIWRQYKLPIICGGSGFYIQAALDGIILPRVKPDHKLRKELQKKSTVELFQMLKIKDPARAKTIDPKNPRRLMRALEIVAALGTVPKEKADPLPTRVLMIGTAKKKKELQGLIAKRLQKRLNLGMLKEIKNLREKGISWQRLENFGLEYKYGALLLQNKINKKEFKEGLIQAILKYAKRQMTWFKKDKRIHWLKNQAETEKLVKKFLKE